MVVEFCVHFLKRAVIKDRVQFFTNHQSPVSHASISNSAKRESLSLRETSFPKPTYSLSVRFSYTIGNFSFLYLYIQYYNWTLGKPRHCFSNTG